MLFLFLILCTGEILLREDPAASAGLCSTLYLCCSLCKHGTPFQTSSTCTEKGKSYDINKRMSCACISTGMGQDGLADLCAFLNMPPPVNSKSYRLHREDIFEKVQTITETQMEAAAKRLREKTFEDDGNIPLAHLHDANRSIDVAVTYDGTWMKRGYG